MNAAEWSKLKKLDLPQLMAKFGIVTRMDGRGAYLFARGLTKELTDDQCQIVCLALMNHLRETTTFRPVTIDLTSEPPR